MIQNIKAYLLKFFDKMPLSQSKKIYIRQSLLLVLILIIVMGLVFGVSFLIKSNKSIKTNKQDNKKVKIQVASESLDAEKMWRNHFEDKLLESDNIMKTQIAKIEQKFQTESEEMRFQNKNEILEIKDELIIARNELKEALNEIIEMRNKHEELDKPFEKNIEPNLSLTNISDEPNIMPPKDNKIYIPETSYISGFLLGGIAVSTSIASSSEPVPVVIRITDRGNLPKNFSMDIKQCRILGSGYGDLSSERAIIRAEVMICQDQLEELVTTTKIAGLIYGDDGMNGIKGHIVDMSSKHIRNAAIGGILSGFAGTMKSEGEIVFGGMGAFKTKSQDVGDKLRNNSLGGMGNAAEKIAEYYIKQAENMSPILLIPGGTKVDIIFTKGAYLGSTNVVKAIHNEMK